MSLRTLAGRLLSPFALSNRTIVWASVIGLVGTLVFVPGRDANPIALVVLLAIALVSQAGFAITVFAARSLRAIPGPAYVAATLLLAGVLRGALISLGAALADDHLPSTGSLLERVVNSAVICLVGGGLIGATFAWRADFQEQYQRLLDRAVTLERAQRADEVIDREVLGAWTSMKTQLDDALRQASQALTRGTGDDDLANAASLITEAIDTQLRPASRAMWQDSSPDHQPITLRALFDTIIGSWRLPLGTILGFFAIVIGIGAVVRIGVPEGLEFTAAYLAITGIVLAASTQVARRFPGIATPIAITTVILLPVILFTATLLVRHVWFDLSPDALADAVIAIQTPICTVLVAMAVEAVHERQRVLDGLQAHIDADIDRLLADEDGSQGDAQRLSLFVHHSVQSELSALAMQLREAALTHDEQTRAAVAVLVLDRMARIEDLDPQAPPWLQRASGYSRIDEVIHAWHGILEITISLPREGACRRDQWHVAAEVIEEALANAARHGDATRVVIAAEVQAGSLNFRIEDDGSSDDHPGPGQAGIGQQWLNRIAPDDWSLEQSSSGSVLSVTIR